MIRKQCGFWIPILSVIAVLLILSPGFTAQAGEDNTGTVVGGITAEAKIAYSDYLRQYVALVDSGELKLLYVGDELITYGRSGGTTAVYTDPDLKTPLLSDPETGKDYYFRTTIQSPSAGRHAYDFSQLQPENCRCSIDGYTAKCVKVIVKILNPIREGERDSVDLVFRIRKKGKEIDPIWVTGITEPAVDAKPDYTVSESS